MAAKGRFGVLSIDKRRPHASSPTAASYSSDDESESDIDIEKRASLLEDYDCHHGLSSGSSSRSSSGSHEPMLRPAHPRSRRKTEASAYRYHRERRRRFSRYFTLALGSTLILFVLNLLRLSWSSARNVELGIGRPARLPPTWEQFPFLKRYHGGIRTLVSRAENKPEYPGDGDEPLEIGVKKDEKPGRRGEEEHYTIPPSEVFNPFPKFDSPHYISEYGRTEECFVDAGKSVRIPQLHAYSGVVKGMPDNIMGSYEELGLRNDVCFERFGRLGPYGLGYSKKRGGTGAGMEGDREGAENVWAETPEVDFKKVRWDALQRRCEEDNSARFTPPSTDVEIERRQLKVTAGDTAADATTPSKGRHTTTTSPSKAGQKPSKPDQKSPKQAQDAPKKHVPRTAVLIRTWGDYNYRDEDILYLRALITELSLHSRGEYHVHFLIHVKDENKAIWANDDVYQEVLKHALPEEFQGMGTLWSEKQMSLVYPGLEESFYRDLPVHGSYRGSFMPVQHFAHQHPEYDFVWNWEMDARYTGHFYHLFDRVSAWARQQPRKLLWERSGRFYVPAAHGSWDDFSHMVRVQTEHGTSSKNNIWQKMADGDDAGPGDWQQARPETPIWGPQAPLDDPPLENPDDPDPSPPTSFHADDYEWGVGEDADLITFNPLFDPDGTTWLLADDVTGYNTTRGPPPRRAAIVATSRLSRRLLSRMHRATSRGGRHMFTEMWPGSVALHHGLKAVYAPHPTFIDRRWPPDYLAAIFNGGRNGAAGGGRLSVFADSRQHNFRGSTWYYDAGFAPNLWRRWLGYKVDNDGGERWERAHEGRMCLPAMLLHPVKEVDLIVAYEDERKVKEVGED